MKVPEAEPPSGRLDGLTILRFAHAFDTGGGVEQHLADLNRELCRRNTLTIIQLHLTLDADALAETEEMIGKSRLIRVPLFVRQRPSAGGESARHRGTRLVQAIQGTVLNWLLCRYALNTMFTHTFLRWRKVPVRPGEPNGAGLKAAELIRHFNVDLVVLHSSGGADASEVINVAHAARVPVALVHHFSNDRLGGVSLRQQASSVEAVGGASWVSVPAYLRKRFSNLSDAVDLDFYRPENARPLPRTFSSPVLYAPGRITPDKGQMDVIKVASLLRRQGLHTTVVFAGRVDSPSFEARLREAVAREGLSAAVEFVGQLSLEQYRDWFGVAHVMLMPTYHHEGMPRTLIDSQAMKIPPIVYDIGGTKEGVRHRETGFLIRLGDVHEIANSAEILLRDPELRRRMADAGRCFVEECFSLQAFASRHEQFYLEVLGRTR